MGLVPARDDDSIDIVAGLLRRVDELERLGASRWGVTAGVWHNIGGGGEPAFQNSWVNFAAGWQVARYRIENTSSVRIEGLVAGGVSGNAAFTLPVGFRPPAHVMFGAGGNIGTQIRLEVSSAGLVQPVWAGGGTSSFFAVTCSFALA